ncbi:universal stress protein [Loigolactobacillus jiayinensis]|uniref:Universal stress protein n=1 Tax=Loigolactobacillus jiayinensis TaxID=2486016 RepID=A0ABW1RDX0_9LACO|nr:universal stress protein [Loigolactobacillus jiayinensis]
MQQYQTILVGLDGSQPAAAALTKAITLAKRERAGLHLVHVIEYSPQVGGTAALVAQAHAKEQATFTQVLATAQQQALTAGVEKVTTAMLTGSARTLLATQTATLIIVGQSGQTAIDRFMLGSFAETIVREATGDVLVVRNQATHKINN